MAARFLAAGDENRRFWRSYYVYSLESSAQQLIQTGKLCRQNPTREYLSARGNAFMWSTTMLLSIKGEMKSDQDDCGMDDGPE